MPVVLTGNFADTEWVQRAHDILKSALRGGIVKWLRAVELEPRRLRRNEQKKRRECLSPAVVLQLNEVTTRTHTRIEQYVSPDDDGAVANVKKDDKHVVRVPFIISYSAWSARGAAGYDKSAAAARSGDRRSRNCYPSAIPAHAKEAVEAQKSTSGVWTRPTRTEPAKRPGSKTRRLMCNVLYCMGFLIHRRCTLFSTTAIHSHVPQQPCHDPCHGPCHVNGIGGFRCSAYRRRSVRITASADETRGSVISTRPK